MKPSRWIWLMLAALLMLGAGGAAWREAHRDRNAPAKSNSAVGFSGGGGKSSRAAKGSRSASAFAALPPHLQKLVRDLEERAQFFHEEHTHRVFLDKEEEVRPLIEALSAEEVKALIAFYHWETPSEAHLGYDLGSELLWKAWGRLDPASAMELLAGELRRGLAADPKLLSTNTPFDPFVASGMSIDSAEIEAIFSGWASAAPREAWDGLSKLLAELPTEPGEAEDSFLTHFVREQIVTAWAAHSPREACEFVRDEIPGAIRGDFYIGLAQGLGEDAPWTWLAAQLDQFDPGDREAFAPVLAAEWARHDPDTAVPWLVDQYPGQAEVLFQIWHREDYWDQGLTWLTANAAGLEEEVRLAALTSALDRLSHRREELLPILASLPRTEATWEFFGRMVTPQGSLAEAFLPPDEARALLERMQAPAEVLERVEYQIAPARPVEE